MAIQVVDNFTVNAGSPIDSRSQVADIAARDAIGSVLRFDGLTVEVLDRGDGNRAVYQLQGGTANSNWVGISEDATFKTLTTNGSSFTINNYGVETGKRYLKIDRDVTLNFSNFRQGSSILFEIENIDTNSHIIIFPAGTEVMNGSGQGTTQFDLANGEFVALTIFNRQGNNRVTLQRP